jgi:hypothetical protein
LGAREEKFFASGGELEEVGFFVIRVGNKFDAVKFLETIGHDLNVLPAGVARLGNRGNGLGAAVVQGLQKTFGAKKKPLLFLRGCGAFFESGGDRMDFGD